MHWQRLATILLYLCCQRLRAGHHPARPHDWRAPGYEGQRSVILALLHTASLPPLRSKQVVRSWAGAVFALLDSYLPPSATKGFRHKLDSSRWAQVYTGQCQSEMLHKYSSNAAVKHHTALVFVPVCSCSSCGAQSRLSAALHREARPLRLSIHTRVRRRPSHRLRVAVQLSDVGRSTPSWLPESRGDKTEVLSLPFCDRRTLCMSHIRPQI